MSRKFHTIVFISIVALFFIGCNQATKKQSPSDAIISLVQQLQEAENELNSEKFASLHENSPEFCVYTDNDQILNYDNMTEMNRAAFKRMRRIQVKFDTLHVRVLSPEMAVAFGPFHQSLTDTAGTTFRLKGETLWIARFKDGRWKFIFAQTFHHPDTDSN